MNRADMSTSWLVTVALNEVGGILLHTPVLLLPRSELIPEPETTATFSERVGERRERRRGAGARRNYVYLHRGIFFVRMALNMTAILMIYSGFRGVVPVENGRNWERDRGIATEVLHSIWHTRVGRIGCWLG